MKYLKQICSTVLKKDEEEEKETKAREKVT